ncbi:MAG: 2-succinyl-5-enolpyruvyl-6-hydroxy-3-cyclohexene-1-carboxylic-acid synthase [Flavobacteriales bacterium]|nr:2-succinyl-5-enolpyruvyl-6-hydroxy-3-cyclohexene-1-carboxylic-acid synthase [Flavobacteriales bacterium]
MFSSKKVVQTLSELFLQYGIEDIVISPGSRNAPLSIHFFNHKKFTTHVVVDERSAGFVALGMSQKTRKPTVLCCTSGSASVNYYPAIVEAFYQNIPLIVLTADRPANYVDIFDGQTIRQKNVFQNHSYGNYELSEEDSAKNLDTIQKALETSILKSGPVHINIPFSEPLYNVVEKIQVSIEKQKIPQRIYPEIDFDALHTIWNNSQKVMILVGMQPLNNPLQEELEKISQLNQVIILTESTSNLNHINFIQHIDSIIFNFDEDKIKEFSPDLLITVGQNIVSKKIKTFLREAKPKNHWHVDEFWHPNTYFCLTEKIQQQPTAFFSKFNEHLKNIDSNYKNLWLDLEQKRKKMHHEFIENVPFSDLKVFSILESKIPHHFVLHFANSSPIRYAQLFDFNENKEVFSNRGASGIDGSSSTAVGYAIKSNKQTTLITGDLSFFYDSNALWNKEIPSNFRIILINNGGGNIFKIIPGPDTSNALESCFEAKHTYTAKHLAQHFNFEYYTASNSQELCQELDTFFKDSQNPKILEVDTKLQENSEILRKYMRSFRY